MCSLSVLVVKLEYAGKQQSKQTINQEVEPALLYVSEEQVLFDKQVSHVVHVSHRLLFHPNENASQKAPSLFVTVL